MPGTGSLFSLSSWSFMSRVVAGHPVLLRFGLLCVLFALLLLLAGDDALGQSDADLSEASQNATRVQREQEVRQRVALPQSLAQPRLGQIVAPAAPQPGS